MDKMLQLQLGHASKAYFASHCFGLGHSMGPTVTVPADVLGLLAPWQLVAVAIVLLVIIY